MSHGETCAARRHHLRVRRPAYIDRVPTYRRIPEPRTPMKARLFSLLILLVPLSFCGCSKQIPDEPQGNVESSGGHALNEAKDQPAPSMISSAIKKAMDKAKRELASKNIEVNSMNVGRTRHDGADVRPKAEISPQGDLLIGGKPVVTSLAQRTLLLDYRTRIIGIAEAGMDIGAQFADLGVQTAKQSLWGKLTGKNDPAVGARQKAQAERIRAAELILCARLPPLLASQHTVAASVPEFQPYATMQQQDVDDCLKHTSKKTGKKAIAMFSD